MLVDSQLWVYYYDVHADEHENVVTWLDQTMKTEVIIIPTIIPVEVSHVLFTPREGKRVDKGRVELALQHLTALSRAQIIPLDEQIMDESIKIVKDRRDLGIGGRDAVILATMAREKVLAIATHDRNLLSLKYYKRIDPTFNPPMELDVGAEFNAHKLKKHT